MALNVGPDFKQRWLEAPEAVRQAYLDDLQRICEVLKPETALDTWIEYDLAQQQKSLETIDTAYAELKARLIEEAKIRRQQALEKKLAEKRAEEEAYAQQLLIDEEQKRIVETEKLSKLKDNVDLEIRRYASRYSKNPDSLGYFLTHHLNLSEHDAVEQIDSLKIRLELEADTLIEQTVQAFRAKLHAAAQDEIAYLLENSKIKKDN
ncbi:cell division protein BlhA [Acinetobacter equi]|uniref:Uncharacterized protein n=1 Tax=Acinetobacter equi TaxID=1324350 RepID=A0A0N9VZ98_9GAMM|nr:hypothetical protein [Acinetobacter equi]ALH94593.1 hypothetical protein AOY20_03035 [Acinetobacter equi]